MRDFEHFFLTRYSAVFARDMPPAQEDWLRYRLGFFVEACLASMTRQSVGNFRWLVFTDDRCSDEFRADFESLAEGCFEPVWTHEVFWNDVYRDAVAERSEAPYLITTRLDSDDAVAIDFVASVQAQFGHQDRLFVDFPRGLQLDRSGAVYRYDHVSNPFVSLIERRQPGQAPMTAFGRGMHGRVRDLGPLREVITPPMWIQVVHGGNLANDIRGPRVHPKVVAERFDIDLAYRQQVALPTLLREKAVQFTRLWLRRLSRPSLALEWARARCDRARGTHDKPVRTPSKWRDRKRRMASRLR